MQRSLSEPAAVPPPIEITHRRVIGIALPMMLANVSTPMLGIADAAVIGQLGVAHMLAGVALGAVMFDFVFWPFAFLRMGTTGLTAQAIGAGNRSEERAALYRALLLALVCGLAVVALQGAIAWAAFGLIEGSAAVEDAARRYFAIRIWSAPLAFANYAILGWFLGRGQAGIGLLLTVFVNGANIAFNLFFVLVLGWGVEGTAAGTLVGEALTVLLGLALVYRATGEKLGVGLSIVLDRAKVIATMTVNRDVFIRTLGLIFVFTFFAAQGARTGDATLAANAILNNLAFVCGYLLDGFATAAEQLGGMAVGARDRRAFDRAVRLSSLWAMILAATTSALLWVTGDVVIDLMTKSPEVRETARIFLPYAAAVPLFGAMAYMFDGIYIGATWSVAMRNLMVASVVVFLVAWALLMPAFGNHGLWAAMLLFLCARAIGQGLLYPGLRRRTFG
jgi:MATE family multidrug resistance protein